MKFSNLQKIQKNKQNIYKKIEAVFLFFVLFIFLFFSVLGAKNESAIMDELAHIPAGYSYVYKGQMSLNQEHPPLVKSLAGFFLLPTKINFPENSPYWKNKVNAQWDFGYEFLYNSNNNPDKIIFIARIAPIILSVLFLLFVFYSTKKLFGRKTAFLALLFLAFSPTIIAHSKYVATDIAAAFGFFSAVLAFLLFLKNPNFKFTILASFVLGSALLTKFSTFFLIPFFLVLAVFWILFNKNIDKINIIKKTGVIFLLSFVLVVWPFYYLNIYNYKKGPESYEKKQEILQAKTCKEIENKYPKSQFKDTACILKNNPFKKASSLVINTSDNPVLRPFSQYFLGLLMNLQRSMQGSKTYFFQKVYEGSNPWYFPFLYAVKETLAFHILTLISIVWFFKNKKKQIFSKEFIKNNFIGLSFFIFILAYLSLSIKSNLNIGIRHLLPIYPFVTVLVAVGIKNWLFKTPDFLFSFDAVTFKKIFIFWKNQLLKIIAFFILILWHIISSISSYPNFLPYTNELIKDKNIHKYVSDSNVDWGQSLKYLAKYTEKNNIKKITVHYFGGGSPKYYLKEKYQPYQKGKMPKGWFAVSAYYATLMQASQDPEENWINNYLPEKIIGNSIFLYYIK